MKKKWLVLSLVATLLFASIPVTAFAKENAKDDGVVAITETELKSTGTIVAALEELEKKLDMSKVTGHTERELNRLSPRARDLYDYIQEYARNSESPLTEDDTLVVLGSYLNLLNSESSSPKPRTTVPHLQKAEFSTLALGSVKEYKVSNQQISDLNKAVGVNTGFWGMAAAIAKIWAKSPTVLTAMLVAIPALGIAGLNACNRYNKGVIIKRVTIGTFSNWTCRSQ